MLSFRQEQKITNLLAVKRANDNSGAVVCGKVHLCNDGGGIDEPTIIHLATNVAHDGFDICRGGAWGKVLGDDFVVLNFGGATDVECVGVGVTYRAASSRTQRRGPGIASSLGWSLLRRLWLRLV